MGRCWTWRKPLASAHSSLGQESHPLVHFQENNSTHSTRCRSQTPSCFSGCGEIKLQQGIKYPKADFFFNLFFCCCCLVLGTHNGHNLFLELSSLPEMAATSGIVSTMSLVEQGIVLCCDRVFSHCWIQVFICLPYLSSSLFREAVDVFKCWTSLGILKLPPKTIPRDCTFKSAIKEERSYEASLSLLDGEGNGFAARGGFPLG